MWKEGLELLAPAPLEKFRIAVPSEYEINLLDALATVGDVHLETPVEARSVLPPLLVDVLEGKVTPQTLNVEEALEVVRKVLRPEDVLLRRYEEKMEEYRRLQKLRRLAERLQDIEVPPENIGKDKLGLVTDLVVVKDEDLTDALKSFLSLGVVVRRARISELEHGLVLIYKRELKPRVDELKNTYGEKFELPLWFYDKLEAVFARLDEEEARVRKELHSLLLETASVLRDAFEFERASRLEVIGNAYRAVAELRKKREVIEDILYTLASLKLADKACRENAFQLSRLGLSKDYCFFTQSIIKERVLPQRELEKLVSSTLPKTMQTQIAEEVYLFYKYLGLRELALKTSGFETKKDEKLVFVYGEDRLREFCNESSLSVYGATLLTGESVGWGYGCVLKVPEIIVESLSGVLRSRYKSMVFVISGEENEVKTLADEVGKRLQTAKNSIVAKVVKAGLSRHNISLEKVAKVIEDSSLTELNEVFKEAFEGKRARPLPQEERFTFLRNLISSIDGVLDEITHLKEEVNNILELPLEVLTEKISALYVVMKDVLKKIGEYLSYEATLEAMYRAQPLLSEVRVFRARRITIVEGYVPANYKDALLREVNQRVPRVLYARFKPVARNEKAPTYVKTEGLLGYLYRLTSMRGTPAYWEIDPTLIFTGLFTVMYGMMFGDVGQGLVLALFGFWLLKTKYPLLGISREGSATLGALATLAGLSSMVFGSLYGFMFFLKPLGTPLISPIHDVYGIIAAALWFGVAQLLLAMILNVVNLIRYGDTLGAVFSGMGMMGIVFYASGVALSYKLATTGFNFSALNSPETSILLWLIVTALIAVLGFGFYEAKVLGHKERLMHATSEVIEMIIAFPANSLSYIRLAAFAMAHEAFSILAENLAALAGVVASYTVANFLVLAIEALAVGIQAMRLTYYEFSTKFFKGEGVPFVPVAPAARREAK